MIDGEKDLVVESVLLGQITQEALKEVRRRKKARIHEERSAFDNSNPHAHEQHADVGGANDDELYA
jgi:hypothetical protein